jgi:hypothetical protein
LIKPAARVTLPLEPALPPLGFNQLLCGYGVLTMDIHERWEVVTKEGEEFLKFEKVENKRSQRPDLHAFLMLEELFPGTSDLVWSASHDEIWLDVDDDQVETLTDEQILELSWCGVRHDGEFGGLCMFV